MDRLTILLFILVFVCLFINGKLEHLTSESNEALQTLSSLYTNQGTLVVPNLTVTGNINTTGNITTTKNISANNVTITGSSSGSCGAKNICMSVAPEFRGNYGLNVSGNIQTEDIISANYANIGSGIAVENTGYIGSYANGGGGQGVIEGNLLTVQNAVLAGGMLISNTGYFGNYIGPGGGSSGTGNIALNGNLVAGGNITAKGGCC